MNCVSILYDFPESSYQTQTSHAWTTKIILLITHTWKLLRWKSLEIPEACEISWLASRLPPKSDSAQTDAYVIVIMRLPFSTKTWQSTDVHLIYRQPTCHILSFRYPSKFPKTIRRSFYWNSRGAWNYAVFRSFYPKFKAFLQQIRNKKIVSIHIFIIYMNIITIKWVWERATMLCVYNTCVYTCRIWMRNNRSNLWLAPRFAPCKCSKRFQINIVHIVDI